MNKLAVAPLSRQSIRNRARGYRMLFGLIDTYFDVIRFLEHTLPEIYPDLSIEIVEKFEGEKMKCGEYDLYSDTIRIPQDRYEKALLCDGRARFDIMHECCHKLLLNPQSLAFCRFTRELKAYEDPEWQADCLAGELLMPVDRIRNRSVDEVVHICGVTESAAKCQLKHTGGSC